MRDTSFRKLKMPPRKRNVKNVNLATKASAVARFDLPDPPELDKQIEIADVVEETSQQDIVTEAAGVPEVMAVEDQTINRNVKRKRRMPLNLTEDQEQDVADWYRDHEILYNRCLKEYKDTKAKMHLFEKKAASMEPICTGDQLKVWIDSMRTLVGKITSKKSGDKARPRTDREDWIMQQFGYLENHIKRVVCPRKKGGQLEKNLPCPSKTTSDTDEGNMSDGEEEEEKTEESDTSTICNTNRRFKKPKKNDRSPSSTKPSTASSIEELLGRADKVHKHLQERMQSQPTDSLSQTKRHFVEMIYHKIMQMDEMAWMDYQTQSFQVLMQFKQSRLQRSHQQLNALPRHLLVSQLPQTASHPSVQSFHHPSQSYSTHHAVDTQNNDMEPSTSSIISQHTMASEMAKDVQF